MKAKYCKNAEIDTQNLIEALQLLTIKRKKVIINF